MRLPFARQTGIFEARRMIPGLRRQEIEKATVRVLRPPSDARPDVRLLEVDGKRIVLKDYASGGTRFKRLLGVYLVAREHRALCRVSHVEGVPRYCGRLDAYALATEYVEAASAPEAPAERLTVEFFASLERIIGELHKRGVVHCDLKKLDNIMVGADGKPYVIDFAAAFVTGSNPLTGLLFGQLQDDDYRGIYKLKKRYVPALLTPQESEFLEFRSAPERSFRRLRVGVRHAVQRWSAGRREDGVSV